MTQRAYKNLSTLSAQLFLGTALVASSAHAATYTVDFAGANADETTLNAEIANTNNQAANTAHTLSITNGANNMVAAGGLTAFSQNGQTITLQADAPTNLTTTGQAGFAGPINLKTDGANVITFTTATANRHSYTGTTTIAGTGGLTLSGANILPATTDVTVQDTAIFTTGAAQEMNSLTLTGGSTTTLGGALTVTTNITVTQGTLTAGAHAITASAGKLTLTDGSVTSSANITVKELEIAASKTLTNTGAVVSAGHGAVSGVLAGTGGLTKKDSGVADNTLTLAAANTFSGALAIEGGTLVSTNAAGLGAAAGNLSFSGATDKELKTSTVAQTTKTGILNLQDAGKVTFNTETDLAFTGLMTNSGGNNEFTKIGAGKLSIGNNTVETTPGTKDDTAYNGTAKVDAGTLEINAGSKIANLAATVSAAAKLSGSGTIGAVTVASTGIIQPGSSSTYAQDLTVASAIMEGGSIIQIYANPANQTEFNKLVVTGNFRLNSTSANKTKVQFYFGNAATPAASYADFLTVGGNIQDDAGATLDGTVTAEATNILGRLEATVESPTGYTATLALDATGKKLSATTTASPTTTTTTSGGTTTSATVLAPHQVAANSLIDAAAKVESPVAQTVLQNIAAQLKDPSLENQLKANGTYDTVVKEFNAFGDALKANSNAAANDLIVKQLNGASTHSVMAAAPAAMTIVTGVISGHTTSALGGSAAGVSGANNFNAVSSAIQDSSVMANLLGTGLSAGSSADAGLGSHYFENGVWLQGFGGWEKRDTRTDVIGSRTVTAGLSIGFDHYISSDVVTGVSLQYANINSTVKENLGKNHANSYSASLFYGAKFGSSIFDASVTVGKTSHKMERTMSVLTTKLTGFAKPQSFDCSAQIGLTGTISEKQFDIKPFISVGYMYSSMDSYKETGFTNMIYARETERFSVGALQQKAGLTFTKKYSLNNGTWKPSITIGYKGSAPIGNDTLKSKLQVLNEWAYQQGFLKSHHMGTLGVKGEWQAGNGFSITAAYEGALGNKIHSHDVMLRIAKRF